MAASGQSCPDRGGEGMASAGRKKAQRLRAADPLLERFLGREDKAN